MIDLHTHTLFSDGELLPSELVRRAEMIGYKAIALTDHVDGSNIDFILPRIARVCKTLNRRWKIRALPGVEITHAPIEEIKPLVKYARKNGAKIVVVHGQTVSEPVIPGTNRSAILARCDIVSHPGRINVEDAKLAKKLGVFLEITTRKSHGITNRHVLSVARKTGAKLVLNTDSHSPDDLITDAKAKRFLESLSFSGGEIRQALANSRYLAGC